MLKYLVDSLQIQLAPKLVIHAHCRVVDYNFLRNVKIRQSTSRESYPIPLEIQLERETALEIQLERNSAHKWYRESFVISGKLPCLLWYRKSCIVEFWLAKCPKTSSLQWRYILTGWRRPIGCLQLQVIFCTRATDYRALLRKMTCQDKTSYDSTPLWNAAMGWLRFVGSLKLYFSFAKGPCKRDIILQKRPIIWRSLLIVATTYVLTFAEDLLYATLECTYGVATISKLLKL